MKKYQIIYADPPWSYRDKRNKHPRLCGGAAAHYDTMSLEGIKNLPVSNLADKNCMLFLWVTFPNLKEGLDVINSWGFKYKTLGFSWIKTNKKNEKPFFGIGYYTKCIEKESKIYILDEFGKISLVSIENFAKKDFNRFKIWSPTGWKKIYNVEKSTQRIDCLKINTSIGSLICSKNHQLPFKTTISKRINGVRTKIDSIFTSESEYIKYKKNRVIDKKLNGTQLLFSKLEMESTNPILYYDDIRLNYDIGFFVGLFLAEGNISNNQIRFSLHAKEMNLFDKIKKTIGRLNLKKDRYFNLDLKINIFKHTDKKAITVYFNKEKIKNLLSYFIKNIENGANGKRLDLDILLNCGIDFRKGLLEGMYEGDGTKTKYKNIRLCNDGLIDDLRILYHSIGIPTTKDSEGCCILNGKKFFSYGLRIINRTKEFDFQSKKVSTITIYDFKNFSQQETYDLSVEDEFFIVNDLVSHNSNCEVCLIGVKGKPIKRSNSVSSVVISKIEKHSKKPDIVREKIVELCGDIPRIELFARNKTDGWDVFGNEVADSIDLKHYEQNS